MPGAISTSSSMHHTLRRNCMLGNFASNNKGGTYQKKGNMVVKNSARMIWSMP